MARVGIYFVVPNITPPLSASLRFGRVNPFAYHLRRPSTSTAQHNSTLQVSSNGAYRQDRRINGGASRHPHLDNRAGKTSRLHMTKLLG
jgi:hypothetical protein